MSGIVYSGPPAWPSDQISLISLVGACSFLIFIFSIFILRECLFRRFISRRIREAYEVGLVTVMDPGGGGGDGEGGGIMNRPGGARFMVEPKLSEVVSKEKQSCCSCWGEFKPLSAQYFPRTEGFCTIPASRPGRLMRMFLPALPQALLVPVPSTEPLGSRNRPTTTISNDDNNILDADQIRVSILVAMPSRNVDSSRSVDHQRAVPNVSLGICQLYWKKDLGKEDDR